MNSTLRAMWLNNLEQIARGTLTRIDRKIEQSGGIVNEDQEIMKYDGEIYYVGQNCENKTKGHVIKMVNQTIQTSTVGQRKSSYLKQDFYLK